jgi:hypothetical protein
MPYLMRGLVTIVGIATVIHHQRDRGDAGRLGLLPVGQISVRHSADIHARPRIFHRGRPQSIVDGRCLEDSIRERLADTLEGQVRHNTLRVPRHRRGLQGHLGLDGGFGLERQQGQRLGGRP